MKRLWVLLSLALPLPGGILRAQDPDRAYELNLSVPLAVGQKFDLANTESQKMRILMKSGKRVVDKAGPAELHTFAAEEEILKVDAGKATLRRWTFSKALKTVDGKEAPLGFQGKTVLVKKGESQETEYVYESGDKLEGDDLISLKKAFHGSEEKDAPSEQEMFAPQKGIKVGESWNPPIDTIAKWMIKDKAGMSIDPKNSKSQFTLKSVSARGGALFGKIAGVIELSLLKMGPMKLNPPLPMTFTIDLDVCIDGKSPDGEAKLALSVDGPSSTDDPGGGKILLEFDIRVNSVMKKKSIP